MAGAAPPGRMSSDAFPAPPPRRFQLTGRTLRTGLLALGAPAILVGMLHPLRSGGPGARWAPAGETLAAPVLRAALAAWGSSSTTAEPPSSVIPAAPFVLEAKSAAERARAVQCLTNAVYYEAALEPDAGQRAVAQVVLNRVRNPNFPHSICGVVYQGWDRPTGCQFSFTCDGSLSRTPIPAIMAHARGVAEQALNGSVMPAVGTATHYHAANVNPWWRPTVVRIVQVGAHIFYRWPGSAGLPGAFGQRYEGGELKLAQAVIDGTAPRPLPLSIQPASPLQAVAAGADASASAANSALFQDHPGVQRVHSTLLMTGERPRPSREQIAAINAMLEQRLPSRKPAADTDPLANPQAVKPAPATPSATAGAGE